MIRPERGVTLTRRTPLGEISRRVLDLSYELPTTNVEVWKYGATTGLTRGTLECSTYSYSLWNSQTNRWTTHPEGFPVIGREGRPFADEGDSGATLFAREGRVIGMVTGLIRLGDEGAYGPHLLDVRDDTLAYCIPIGLILDALGVVL